MALLSRLDRPHWDPVRRAADLGCGTGRTAAWLRDRSPATIDGIDLSNGMPWRDLVDEQISRIRSTPRAEAHRPVWPKQ